MAMGPEEIFILANENVGRRLTCVGSCLVFLAAARLTVSEIQSHNGTAFYIASSGRRWLVQGGNEAGLALSSAPRLPMAA